MATTRKPRIITLTVTRLRRHATWLDEKGETHAATDLRSWADELNAYDARETKIDPSKKRKPAKMQAARQR
jgi:hypothetical protein